MASPLFEAVKAGDNKTALDLIRSGADVNARGTDGPAPADGGATVLLAAIRNFDVTEEVVMALLDKGADPNLADTIEKETPLMATARTYPYKSPGDAIVKALLKRGANAEQRNMYGDTALHVAASCGAALQCAVLIGLGADYKAKDAKKKTAEEIASDVATRSSIEEAVNLKTG